MCAAVALGDYGGVEIHRVNVGLSEVKMVSLSIQKFYKQLRSR